MPRSCSSWSLVGLLSSKIASTPTSFKANASACRLHDLLSNPAATSTEATVRRVERSPPPPPSSLLPSPPSELKTPLFPQLNLEKLILRLLLEEWVSLLLVSRPSDSSAVLPCPSSITVLPELTLEELSVSKRPTPLSKKRVSPALVATNELGSGDDEPDLSTNEPPPLLPSLLPASLLFLSLSEKASMWSSKSSLPSSR
mmetsp:Transcript_6218/g.11651  ORF Transcript_6218/g.11651 Transcript_6218/m.11651 type:complete len:200 (+) Transcript_6218:153-752(+)